jgi:hypothetical protein
MRRNFAMISDDDLRVTKVIPLEIPKGYYVFSVITTMAGYNITVSVRDADTKKTYITETRAGLNPLPPCCKFEQCMCEKSELCVDIPQSAQIDLRMDKMDINDKYDNLIIRNIVAVGEDANDLDYNDFIINLSVMKSRV